MSKRAVLFAAALVLAAAPILVAQGRGGQGGGGPQSGMGQQGQPGMGQQGQQPGMGQSGSPQDMGQGQQQANRDQQRQRIHATDQQRNQYNTCTQSADRVRTQARTMADAAKGGGANNQEFRQQQEQLARSAQDASQLADTRYRAGLTSYLEVLTNETNYFAAELGLAQARVGELEALVQLYRALGGGWQQ